MPTTVGDLFERLAAGFDVYDTAPNGDYRCKCNDAEYAQRYALPLPEGYDADRALCHNCFLVAKAREARQCFQDLKEGRAFLEESKTEGTMPWLVLKAQLDTSEVPLRTRLLSFGELCLGARFSAAYSSIHFRGAPVVYVKRSPTEAVWEGCPEAPFTLGGEEPVWSPPRTR